VPCYIVFTTPETERAVRENLHLSSMYGGHVEGVGPRYCPSIEDKYVKFPDKERHQIFVEPDSLDTKELYLSGLSTSMPFDVQLQMVRSLPGFECAEILRPGYSIEYDSLDPLQLDSTLAVSGTIGLWTAGQVNGTTGYEEAAGQGLIAGANAARFLQNKEPFVISRFEAYLGVMIDDIVTKGADEPYRMLTARAELRLDFAADLADVRLLDRAKSIGVLTQAEIAQVEGRAAWRESLLRVCDAAWVKKTSGYARFALEAGLCLEQGMTVAELLKRQQLGTEQIDEILKEACDAAWVKKTSPYARFALDAGLGLEQGMTVAELLKRQQFGAEPIDEILKETCADGGISRDGVDFPRERDALLFAIRYSGYREREAKLASHVQQWESIHIPPSLLEGDAPGLSLEVREKLRRHRPGTLGQASRVPGVTHAAVVLLHMYIEKGRR
jgi:tRNA uridine 5-carboxymethylaminomethyl modification enzyme